MYGQSLGSVAPDMYAFSGLSVLLTMVVLGLGSLGAGVGTGLFLGGPTLTNLFPSLLKVGVRRRSRRSVWVRHPTD